MTQAERAYQEALRRIKEAAETQSIILDLSITDLDRLPPEIANLTALKLLELNSTQVSDLAHIANLTALKTLNLSNTQVNDLAHIASLTALEILGLSSTEVSDLAHIANLTALEILGLNSTEVSDLRPVLKCRNLISTEEDRGLYFDGSLATQVDPELDRLSKIEDVHERTQQTFAYLDTLPPYPDPLPWLRKSQTPSPAKTILSVEAVIEAQDSGGWVFSPQHSVLEFFISKTPLDERRRKLAELAAERQRDLMNKISIHNATGLRRDVATEVTRFGNILADNSRSLDDRSLELWTSLISLGNLLDGNDVGRVQGRDPLDLLSVEIRAALQTLISIAASLVRSFPEAEQLDNTVSSFNRSAISSALILALLEKALAAKLIDGKSAALMQHVEYQADGDGRHADKATSVSRKGVKNLILSSALYGGLGLTGIAGTAITTDVTTDISDHYEFGEQTIELVETIRAFFSGAEKDIQKFMENLPPDEAATIKAAIKDLRSGPDRI